jgi:hypothetical protein
MIQTHLIRAGQSLRLTNAFHLKHFVVCSLSSAEYYSLQLQGKLWHKQVYMPQMCVANVEESTKNKEEEETNWFYLKTLNVLGHFTEYNATSRFDLVGIRVRIGPPHPFVGEGICIWVEIIVDTPLPLSIIKLGFEDTEEIHTF